MNAAGAVLSAIGGPKQEYSGEKGSVTKGLDSAYDVAQTAVGFIPGVGTLVSGLMSLNKGVTGMLNKWGGGTDAMTDVDAVLGSNWFGPIGSINGFTGKKAHTMDGKDFMTQAKLGNMWAGYSDTYGDYSKALTKEGKKYGGFSSGARKRANRLIDQQNINKEYLLDMNNETELGNIRGNGMAGLNATAYNIALSGGFKPISLGRQGFKISSLKEAINSIDRTPKSSTIIPWKPTEEEIEMFQQGGKSKLTDKAPQAFKQGGQMNVIPEGSLHARLHHMEDADGLTKKGIPVVDNEGNQQAEIELNEIIFRKEVTDKLEELSKDGSNKAAEEAGRILVEEIFENTDDRTGLIKELTGDTTVLKAEFGAAMPLYVEWMQKVVKDKNKEKANGFSQAILETGQALVDGILNADKAQKELKAQRQETQLNNMAQFQNEEQQRLAIRDAIAQREEADKRDRETLYAQKYAMSAQEGDKIPTLEEFKQQKRQEIINAAIQKAITRKSPYKLKGNLMNCIATALNNYYEIPPVWSNQMFAENPEKYGFRELEFGDTVDTLPEGVLIQDYNKPKNPNVPGHTVMLVSNKEGEKPLYSYSSGKNVDSDMHNQVEYGFYRWDNKTKPRAYAFVGNPDQQGAWEKEYYSLYPKFEEGGVLQQDVINQLLSLPPEKLKELQNILKYLGQ